MIAVMPDPPSATREIQRKVSTGSAQRGEFASDDRGGWLIPVESSIRRWCSQAADLDDDDLSPPTPEVVRRAREISERMELEGQPRPTRVVLDTDGGVAFELEAGAIFQSLNIHPDGSAELLTFKDSKLISREMMPV